MTGHYFARRHCAFKPTSCAACRAADGEILDIQIVAAGQGDHINGQCSFTFYKTDPREPHLAPPAPAPEPEVDPCEGIRMNIHSAEMNRDYQQSLANWYMAQLQRPGARDYLTEQQIMQYTSGMLAAVDAVDEYNRRLQQLYRELEICEAGGHI